MSRADAEDLAQDVCMVLLQKYNQVANKEELLRLAYTILMKLRIGRWRRVARRGENTAKSVDDLPLKDPGDDPETVLRRKEFAEKIGKAIRSLGEPCRTVLLLKFQKHDTAYIQRAIGAPTENAVFLRLSRCRDKLDQKLGGIVGRAL